MTYDEWLIPDEDTRPVIAICAQCGEAIFGSDKTHWGDTYYEVDGVSLHDECVMDYLNDHCLKGGE